MEVRVAGRTDPGRERSHNEDYFDVDSAPGLWALSDGMGGHQGGEVASRVAVEAAVAYWREQTEREPAAVLTQLAEAVQQAHAAVRAEAAGRPDLEGMGGTLVLATLREGHYYLAHVGDSRAYLLHEGELHCLTRDHTVVQTLLDAGVINPAQAEMSPHRHILEQALGHGDVKPDVAQGSWEPGDLLLLCSDGLHDVVSDEAIAELLRRYGADPAQACERLIAAANEAGGPDNITVIVAAGPEFKGPPQPDLLAEPEPEAEDDESTQTRLRARVLSQDDQDFLAPRCRRLDPRAATPPFPRSRHRVGAAGPGNRRGPFPGLDVPAPELFPGFGHRSS